MSDNLQETSQLDRIESQLAALNSRLDGVENLLKSFLADKIEPLLAEVTPTLEAVMSSPLGRMIGGKRK